LPWNIHRIGGESMSQSIVNVSINFPEGLLDTMNYETVIINPASESIGIAILSQETQNQQTRNAHSNLRHMP
jgi:hypothetical protein